MLLFVIFLAAMGCQAPPRGSENIEFIVLQMNDVYEIAPLEGGKAGGLARVAAIRQELLQENPNTIAVLAGDFLSPSFIATLKGDEGEPVAGLQMVEALNALGLDYATFGNHEFDLKPPELLEKRMGQSRFRYISCNAFYRTDDGLRPFRQPGQNGVQSVPPYVVHEFEGRRGKKVRVAIIGVVLPFNQAPYVHYEPVTDAFREAVRSARKEADVLIGLTHLSEKEDLELAREVAGVPLFMGGHDHENMNHYVENTIITKADANAKTVYIHRFTYNPASGMVRIRSTLRKVDESIPDEPATQQVVEKWESRVGAILSGMGFNPGRTLMTTEEPLICTEALIRNVSTNYGRLAARAFETVWPGADAYLLNSGSMRLDDNISGVVTEYDIIRTFPFGGPIVRMDISGEVLQRVIRTGLVDNRGEGGYLQVWNVGWESGQVLVNGSPVDPGKRYAVVLPEFLAKGLESNFGFLKDFSFEERERFVVEGQEVPNDIRYIVAFHMVTRE